MSEELAKRRATFIQALFERIEDALIDLTELFRIELQSFHDLTDQEIEQQFLLFIQEFQAELARKLKIKRKFLQKS